MPRGEAGPGPVVVRPAGRDLDLQVVYRVVVDIDSAPVEPIEDDRRQPTEALVPVYKRVITHQDRVATSGKSDVARRPGG